MTLDITARRVRNAACSSSGAEENRVKRLIREMSSPLVGAGADLKQSWVCMS